MSVQLDPAAGIAYIGDHQVPIRLHSATGALQIGGDDGPVVGPLTFHERTRLVAYAAVARTPHQAMGHLVADAARAAATSPAGETESSADAGERTLITAIIAMTLAGANEPDLPAFGEAALLVAQATGWSPAQLAQADAVEVDRLAKLVAPREEDGWTRLLFHEPAATDLAAIHDTLAANLLERLQSTGVIHQPGQPLAQPAADGEPPGHPPQPAASDSAPSRPARPLVSASLPAVVAPVSPAAVAQTAPMPGSAALQPTRLDSAPARLTGAHQPTGPAAAPFIHPRRTYRLRGSPKEMGPLSAVPRQQQPGDAPGAASPNQASATGHPASPPLIARTATSTAWPPVSTRDSLPGSEVDRLTAATIMPGLRASTQGHATPAARTQQEADHLPLSPATLHDLTVHDLTLYDLIDELAARLHLEADLRGIDR